MDETTVSFKDKLLQRIEANKERVEQFRKWRSLSSVLPEVFKIETCPYALGLRFVLMQKVQYYFPYHREEWKALEYQRHTWLDGKLCDSR